MANVLNKTTGQYLRSVNEPEYPETAWIWSPDLSAFGVVGGYKQKYAVLPATNPVQIMDQAGRDAVDAAEEATRIANIKAELKARFSQENDNTKAMGLLMLEMYQLIRAEIKAAALNNPLPDITAQQLKTRFDNIVDGL